jgi:DNA polymerase elongation subunit (family B)
MSVDRLYTSVENFKGKLLYRGYENGRRVQQRANFKPTLYVPSNEPTGWQALDGTFVLPRPQESIKASRDFIDRYKGMSNFNVYGNIPPQYEFINKAFPKTIDYNADLIRVAYLDIEVETRNGFAEPADADQPITAISLKSAGKYYVFGLKDYDVRQGNVEYYLAEDEEDLLQQFIATWRALDVDVVTGWNVQFFDIPYLVNRITNVFDLDTARKLSPWGHFTTRNAIIHGREQVAMTLVGIAILDYLELYKKFTFTQQSSYKLNHIAYIELGQEKVDYSEYGTLHDLYDNDYQKFIDYNIQDVELIERLEAKMKFIEQAYALAYSAKVNLNDVFSQVRMWDVMIHNYLMERHIVIPQKKESKKDEKYAGAYVAEPITGMHDWVVSFDLASLYPHLIMMYNISPETLTSHTEKISIQDVIDRKASFKDSDVCVAANGHTFRRDVRGFLPEMMQMLYNQRKEYKRSMIEAEQELVDCAGGLAERDAIKNKIAKFKNFQLARKVQLNSAYGALGNQYFRHYDLRQAEAITMSGQLSIRWIATRLNEFLNKACGTEDNQFVIAGDTDSVYLNLKPVVDKFYGDNLPETSKVIDFLDSLCQKKIQPFIDKSYQELSDTMNAYEQKMDMEREVIADRGVWVAKKRYMLNVHDSEGVRYDEPKLKIMGLEAVKSSTPAACRDNLKKVMRLILTHTESDVIDFIEAFRKEFKTLPLDEIAFPRGVNGLRKYRSADTIWKKSTPIHVKGALIYNHMREERGVAKKYEEIRDGDKLKFVHLREPNEAMAPVISFPDERIPAEFNLSNVIDHDTQFDKAFVEPLKIILDTIGWQTERKSTLEAFFS